MRRSFTENEHGRIPFAYVALVILLLSVAAGSYMLDWEDTHSREKARDAPELTSSFQDLSALDLETTAYYIVHEVLRERMEVQDGNDTQELDLIDELVRERMAEHIAKTYPATEEIFTVSVLDWDIHILLDEMNTTDLVRGVNTTTCGRTYVMPNSSLTELDNMAPPYVFPVSRSVYFRIVGHARYSIYNADENIVMEKYTSFNKNVYSPLPLMKNLAMRFSSDSSGEFSSLGKMIRYMVTTMAQYRVLCGFAGGGYGGENTDRELANIITPGDVEIAVNLALLLAQARYFRDFDQESAAEQEESNNSDFHIEKLMDNYVTNGSIDPADLISLYTDLENETIDVGRTFAQSIYSFSDRFVWELMDLFWGDEWGPEDDGIWDNALYFDPTLEDPIVDWEEIEAKGDTEDWCKARLMRWLEVFGKWLGLTETGDENGDIVKIEAQQEESAVIKDIYARYRHPPNAGDVAGKPSGADLCNVAVPPPGYGPPDYYVTGTDAYHVDGRYYLFGDASDSTTSNKRWYVRSYVRPEESSPGDSTDARFLLLGESPGVGGDEGRPYTYKMVCRDDWGSGVPEKTYEYYLVEESLIEKHRDYHEPGLSYYNTLRFIVDALTRSMKQQPSDINNVNSKGMLDYAAHDTDAHFDELESDLVIDPKDKISIIGHGLNNIMEKDGGAVNDAVVEFGSLASQEKENWFREGAYLNDSGDPDSSGEYFLYEVIRETVDLWYEMLVNLYDGGYREFDEDGSSTYGPEDGPNHWNNYDNTDNSQLPEDRFQTSEHESESGSDKLAGSFKFRNDALRDCYYRVMELVKTRDDAVEFSFNNWEDLGSRHWIWTVTGSCGQAGILYGWFYSGSGIAAVPLQDRVDIPRECYDGTGSVEDLTPYDEPWKNPADTYAEAIWDILKKGNSGQTNLANNDWGEGIAGGVGNVVGWSGWPETTGEGLLDDAKVEFIEGSGGQGGLDLVTDEGAYGSFGGSYDFNSDFYDLVRMKVTSRFIDDNALVDLLSKEGGWLDVIVRGEMADRVDDNLDVFNIPYLTATRSKVPWNFWHGNRTMAAENGSLFTEVLVVDQVPNRLEEGTDDLDIVIKIPVNGAHFVDVQDLEFPMSKDCFSTVWWINITAGARYRIRNSRLSSVGDGRHEYFWYNHTMDMDIDFPVPIFSGWDLESGWQTGEIDYRMTRDYFYKVEEDTPEDPFFVSKALTETMDATKDACDWMMDTKMAVHDIILEASMQGSREKSFMISELTDAIMTATDPREDEEGLLEAAGSDSDYLNNISGSATELEDSGLVDIGINFFGYEAVYHTSSTTLDIARGETGEEDNDTAFGYTMKFDSDMNFTGTDRIAMSVLYTSSLSGRPADLSFSGELSPYNERTGGIKYNFTMDTGGDTPQKYAASGRIQYLPLPVLDVNATVEIGIVSSVPIPDELMTIVRDTGRYELEEHRGPDLTGQCGRYIRGFLGSLYNDHIAAFSGGDRFGITFNVTDTPAVNSMYLNRSVGIDLSRVPGGDKENVLRLFVKHVINNTDHLIGSLMDPSVPTSFFLKVPAEVEPYLEHSVRHWSDGGDVYWRGTMAQTMTTTPFLGSAWDMGERLFVGGMIYGGGAGRYLLRFAMDAGI